MIANPMYEICISCLLKGMLAHISGVGGLNIETWLSMPNNLCNVSSAESGFPSKYPWAELTR